MKLIWENLVSRVPIIINKKYAIIAPGQAIKTFSVLNDDIFNGLAFPYLSPRGKLDIMLFEMWQ